MFLENFCKEVEDEGEGELDELGEQHYVAVVEEGCGQMEGGQGPGLGVFWGLWVDGDVEAVE